MRVIKLLKEQDGVVLVLVMITLMVVALLGSVAVAVSIGENKQSNVMDRDMRAYYLAHSAADATITYIKNEIIAMKNNLDALLPITTEDGAAEYEQAKVELEMELEKVVPAEQGKENSKYSDSIEGIGNGEDKKVESVQVWRDGLYIYVKATAIVNNVSSSAIVRLNQEEASRKSYTISKTTTTPATTNTAGLFDDAIYAAGDIDLSNNNSYDIYGNVTCGKSCKFAKNRIKGTITENDYKDWPDWNPPVTLTSGAWPASKTFSSSGKYSTAQTISGDWTIATGSGNDVILYFTELKISNNATIKATGTGRVFIYVDKFSQGNKFDIWCYDKNGNRSSTNPFVYFILDKATGSAMDLGGGGELDAFVYAPGSAVDTAHGNPKIFGAVICKLFTGKGNFNVTSSSTSLTEEDFNGGSSNPTTTTETKKIEIDRLGEVGTDGTQWIKEGIK